MVSLDAGVSMPSRTRPHRGEKTNRAVLPKPGREHGIAKAPGRSDFLCGMWSADVEMSLGRIKEDDAILCSQWPPRSTHRKTTPRSVGHRSGSVVDHKGRRVEEEERLRSKHLVSGVASCRLVSGPHRRQAGGLA